MRNLGISLSIALIGALVVACSGTSRTSGFDDPGSDGNNGNNNGGNNGNGLIGGGTNGDGGSSSTSNGSTGQVDKTASCDSGLAIDDADAASFAKAIGICGSQLVSATYSRGYGMTEAPHAGQWGLLPKFGSVIVPREGAAMGVISSGYGREYDNTSGTDQGDESSAFVAGTSLDGDKYPTGAAPPGFPKAASGCQQDNKVNDMVDVKLTLKAPSDASGIQFDFNFWSSEWPNWVCSNFNDAFTAYLTSQKTTDNISFDSNSNPVAVNNNFFNRCTPNTTVGCDSALSGGTQSVSACAAGVSELQGTGFGYTEPTDCFDGSGAGASASAGGATGWLTTTAPITPGETFTLEFMIWDAGDGNLDSSVLIDNFQWIGGNVTTGTSRVN
jgi:hypothetical protein